MAGHDAGVADFSIKPTLVGERVVLRPLAEEDVAPLDAILREPEVLRLTGSVHADGETFPGAPPGFLEWRNAQTDRVDLAVTLRDSGECVGEAVLNQYDAGNRGCNFRILVGAAGQGRGAGTEATRLLVGYGFEELGLHRISLEVYAFNPRARHVYEKVGFVTEGVLRQVLHYGDDWIDATVMSILAPEWAAHRGHPG
jgi:RimJ/RimL family protein N-acetyltransferase